MVTLATGPDATQTVLGESAPSFSPECVVAAGAGTPGEPH